MTTQVLNRSQDSDRVVGEEGDGLVAIAAQQFPHLVGDVVMVDVQDAITNGWSGGRNASADGACSSLGFEHGLVLVNGEPVFLEPVSGSGSFQDVRIFTPGFMSFGYSLGFPFAEKSGIGSTLVPAEQSAVAAYNQIDFAFTASAPSGSLYSIDSGQSMRSAQFTSASPSVVGSLDGDAGQADRAIGLSVVDVDVAQVMDDVSPVVTAQVSTGLTVDPSSGRVVVSGDVGQFSTPAMARTSGNRTVLRACAWVSHRTDRTTWHFNKINFSAHHAVRFAPLNHRYGKGQN